MLLRLRAIRHRQLTVALTSPSTPASRGGRATLRAGRPPSRRCWWRCRRRDLLVRPQAGDLADGHQCPQGAQPERDVHLDGDVPAVCCRRAAPAPPGVNVNMLVDAPPNGCYSTRFCRCWYSDGTAFVASTRSHRRRVRPMATAESGVKSLPCGTQLLLYLDQKRWKRGRHIFATVQ